jgi:hypothetical protein
MTLRKFSRFSTSLKKKTKTKPTVFVVLDVHQSVLLVPQLADDDVVHAARGIAPGVILVPPVPRHETS